MSVSQEYAGLLKDLLAPLGDVSIRRMFSGAGVYCDGVIFGLAIDDTLYLKTNASTRPAFQAEGCSPFAYDGRGRRVETSYWRAPERLLDEPDELVDWARIALGAAREKAARAPKRKAPRPKTPRRGKAGA